MEWPHYTLREVAPATPSRNTLDPNDTVWHLGLDQIESHTGIVLGKHRAPVSEAGNSTFHFDQSHVLYSKLRPYLNKVVVPDEPGIATTELVPLKPHPHLVCREFLAYYLRSPAFLTYASQYVTGAKMPRVILDRFWAHEIALPPLSEQRRIVEILDQAHRLRRLRAEADAKAERLLPALFAKMFGDLTANPMEWNTKPFRELLTKPPRNGLSPSSTGTFHAKVLTLSAITGRTFDETATKGRYFAGRPSMAKKVDPRDFLICRGNGNLEFVGRARFPHRKLGNTLFPDTIIAARVDPKQANGAYLEVLWHTNWMRSQIESRATTTSGIHKINQATLGGLAVRLPPLDLQARFETLSNRMSPSVQLRSAEMLNQISVLLSHRVFLTKSIDRHR